ncbi:unnamed protein product [Prorocentrum cordatum]|uniref:KHDC4/BBP-like KH-domain type I domain-containing protein n=1 Tax=Prorocentrum cordatum TaxID=2364126 RepID=A0ABN9WLN1_9DINO|nr:unnamed protein product [Polarella glacialis]
MRPERSFNEDAYGGDPIATSADRGQDAAHQGALESIATSAALGPGPAHQVAFEPAKRPHQRGAATESDWGQRQHQAVQPSGPAAKRPPAAAAAPLALWYRLQARAAPPVPVPRGFCVASRSAAAANEAARRRAAARHAAALQPADAAGHAAAQRAALRDQSATQHATGVQTASVLCATAHQRHAGSAAPPGLQAPQAPPGRWAHVGHHAAQVLQTKSHASSVGQVDQASVSCTLALAEAERNVVEAAQQQEAAGNRRALDPAGEAAVGLPPGLCAAPGAQLQLPIEPSPAQGPARPRAAAVPSAAARCADSAGTAVGHGRAPWQLERRPAEAQGPRPVLRLRLHILLHMKVSGFDLIPRLIGHGGCNTRSISTATGAKVRIRGRGSGHFEGKLQREAPTPLMVAVTAGGGEAAGFVQAVRMTLQERRRPSACTAATIGCATGAPASASAASKRRRSSSWPTCSGTFHGPSLTSRGARSPVWREVPFLPHGARLCSSPLLAFRRAPDPAPRCQGLPPRARPRAACPPRVHRGA